MDSKPVHVTLKEHPEISIRKEKLFNEIDVKGRRTKIICTLGPTSNTDTSIVSLLDAGMNIARINFSHGDHRGNGKLLNTFREACKRRPKVTCAVLLDTKGPEIRTGQLTFHRPVTIEKYSFLKITTDYTVMGTEKIIACSYPYLNECKVGQRILIADGSLEVEVVKQETDGVCVVALNKATIGEFKNMALPGMDVKLPALSSKDVDDIQNFAVPNNMDMIAASFIRKASDVLEIRKILGEQGKNIKIISKIENHEGLRNYEEILEVSDAIMIARGDLGMEVPFEKVFVAQKWMIDLANMAGKPVVVATQMLESMIQNSRPTRAEITDVANAVLDGADAVMLSGETANGLFPQQAVEAMAKICCQAEICVNYHFLLKAIKSHMESISIIEQGIIDIIETDAVAIFVVSKTGRAPQLVNKFKPNKFIYAISENDTILRNYCLNRSVRQLKVQSVENTVDEKSQSVQEALEKAIELKYIKKGDKIELIIASNEDNQLFNLSFKQFEC